MTRYASTFTAGLQEVVQEMLLVTFPGVRVVLLLEGFIVYEGDLPLSKLREARFFNNSFIVLRTFQRLGRHPIPEMLRAISRERQLDRQIAPHITRNERGKSFRIVASDENQFVSVDRRLLQQVEEALSGIQGLRVNRARPHFEFWFLYRRAGYGFFLKRLTTHTAYEEVLEKGELKPELAHALIFLSEPDAADIFLDPFSGSGAIPFERVLSHPFNMIFAGDRDPDKVRRIRKQAQELRTEGLLIGKRLDALNMDAFEDGFIHKLVTDPPWGLYEPLEMDARDFHTRMLAEFHRVLAPGGLLVVLTARKEEFEQSLAGFTDRLRLLARYDILVSGKKAAIFKVKALG